MSGHQGSNEKKRTRRSDCDDASEDESGHGERPTDECSSELDVNTSSSKKKLVNSNALKTKQWREKQKLLHEKRKEDLDKVREENARLRRENEELRQKIMTLEGSDPRIIPPASAALPTCVPPGMAGNVPYPRLVGLSSILSTPTSDLLSAGGRQITPNIAALLAGGCLRLDSAGARASAAGGDAELLARLLSLQRSHQPPPCAPINGSSASNSADLDLAINHAILQQQHSAASNDKMFPNGVNSITTSRSHDSPLSRLENYLSNSVNVPSAVAARALLEENQMRLHQSDASLRLALQQQGGSASMNAQLLAALHHQQRQQLGLPAFAQSPNLSSATNGSLSQVASSQQSSSPQETSSREQSSQTSNPLNLTEEQLLVLLAAKRNKK